MANESVTPGPLPEFDREMATTRRVLERVPGEKGEWRPHPKSFPLGHLAQLVAGMPFWFVGMIESDHIDLGSFAGYTYESTETLLAQFDAGVAAARQALARVTDEQMAQPWALKHGDHVLSSEPRGSVIRTQMLHMVHHRAQLGVYLRLLDVPVPCMYGPTADESWSG